jgi:glycosyltransferase involved in cell wall biosynthesis
MLYFSFSRGRNKMIVTMKCLNEERSVDRVMRDIHDEKWVEKIVVIDGGSTDLTVHELKKWPKVWVFKHPWLDEYHDMEIVQSNIALSYVPHGRICFILDFDERCSEKLKEVLSLIDKDGLPEGVDVAHVSRETYEVMRHEASPFCVYDDDGWPLISHQIGQYPDFQCRIIKRSLTHHWVNSPHHQLAGYEGNANYYASLFQYEKDDARDRERIEKKWARAQSRRRELGLSCDIFESRMKPDLQKYTRPETWKGS